MSQLEKQWWGWRASQINSAAWIKVLRLERVLHSRVTEVRSAPMEDITNQSQSSFFVENRQILRILNTAFQAATNNQLKNDETYLLSLNYKVPEGLPSPEFFLFCNSHFTHYLIL